MPGLVPGIHVFSREKDVDGRDKPGHDEINGKFDHHVRSHHRCPRSYKADLFADS
jgi:hypothetical protein